jgi:hypothetical protein
VVVGLPGLTSKVDFASRVESNLVMSRRDIVVNTLLGLFLVAAFLLPSLLVLLVAGYVLRALNLTIQHFFPGTVDPRVLIVGVSLLFSLVSGVMQARKKQWRNVFLAFAMIPVIASMWLADAHSPFGLQANFWAFGLLPMYAIGEGSDLTQSHFFLAASAICAAIAINAGLLGSGSLSRIVAACVLDGGALWFIITVRRGGSNTQDPGETVPISPTRT